jgi:hypothetical protein
MLFPVIVLQMRMREEIVHSKFNALIVDCLQGALRTPSMKAHLNQRVNQVRVRLGIEPGCCLTIAGLGAGSVGSLPRSRTRDDAREDVQGALA